MLEKGDAGRLPYASKCPEATWIKRYFHEESNIGSEDFIGISVGCNKGHDAIRMARMGLSSSVFDGAAWKAALGDLKAGAICRQDSTGQEEVKFPKRNGTMHCIEPMPSTIEKLKNASKSLGLERQGFVVTHAAISSVDGSVKFPSGDLAGSEGFSMDDCIDGKVDESKCVEVPMYSLESYVDRFVTRNGPINVLQIDVEGFDFDVLFGAGRVLDRTNYIEFEYHIVGNWGGLHLLDAVKLLDGKGFTCYWAGYKGNLWKITGCYIPIYDSWHGWSNVACVHRLHTNLADRMENQFLQTLSKW